MFTNGGAGGGLPPPLPPLRPRPPTAVIRRQVGSRSGQVPRQRSMHAWLGVSYSNTLKVNYPFRHELSLFLLAIFISFHQFQGFNFSLFFSEETI
uniref:Uncharacterized protein n=1 Tax=Oryza meridionalis TaxID=40149 RepID=A0A0E0EN84_9ORYZ